MMDVALITANANQLRFIVEYNQSSKTYVLAIALIIISLVLQMIVGICLIFKGNAQKQKQNIYFFLQYDIFSIIINFSFQVDWI